MISIDRNALACDLAETYHIYDYKELPVRKAALFSIGLRADSRIKLKMVESEYSLETLLLAGIADKVSMLVWFKTEDGMKGNNRPQSILATMMGVDVKGSGEYETFMTGEDFLKRRNELLGKGGEGDG